MPHFFLHVIVENLAPAEAADVEAKFAKLLEPHGFVRETRLKDGDTVPLARWMYAGEASDDTVVSEIGKELHLATKRELYVLISPGEPTYGWHSPGSIMGIIHLDPDVTSNTED